MQAAGPAGSRAKAVGLGLLELALIGTVLFSVATAFDHLHRWLELFSHFRLQYLGMSLVLSIAFLLLRWRGYVLLGLATTVLNAWFVVPWYLPAGGPPATADQAIAIMSANVLASNDDSARLLQAVADAEPDILFLQEVTAEWASALAPLSPSYPYRVVEPRADNFGVALLSKFPLEAAAIIDSVPRGFPDVVATAIVGGTRLNIVALHTMPPIGAANYGARNLHLASIAELAARTPAPLVVVGDLNITMWANHYRRFEADSGLINARRGFGILPTWPTFLPPAMIPIDHCFVSPDIGVLAFDTGPRIGSDHLPIVVRVALPGGS